MLGSPRLLSLLAAAALGASALPAAAATQVTVNVAGLDAGAAHATIVRAATAACQVELRDASQFQQYYLRPDCINAAVARAEAKLETARAGAVAQARIAGR
jgi:hypothetical protein